MTLGLGQLLKLGEQTLHFGIIAKQGILAKDHDLDDDIQSIAESLKNHPMVDYSTQDSALSHKEVVEKTWLRITQSSVWLERYNVLFTISRVAFYTKGVRHWPLISFLRVQIHDQDWKELHDYGIHWQGETIRFLRILDIPAPYVIGDAFFGPEDPRVIIGDHADAEPIVVFNMLYDAEKLYRAMFIKRALSNDTTMLQIAGGRPEQSEKNWMPFVHKKAFTGNAPTGVDVSGNNEWPTHHLHFIYDFKPLRILQCHLLNGWCDWVYRQEGPDFLTGRRHDTGGVFRGGTNLVPVSARDGLQTFVGSPKSNVHVGCKEEAFCRPSLLVVTATSPNHFHVDYMSDSIEFGGQALTPTAKSDPYGGGHIMMANSIAKWDRSAGEDLMIITYTVDEVTTQTLRLHGVEAFVDSIHDHKRLSPSMSESMEHLDSGLLSRIRSEAGYNILACAVEAAEDYAILLAEEANCTDGCSIRLEEDESLRENKRRGPGGSNPDCKKSTWSASTVSKEAHRNSPDRRPPLIFAQTRCPNDRY